MPQSPAAINFDQRGYATYNPQSGSPAVLNTSGDHVLYTPASGKSIRLKWIGIKAPRTNNGDVVITIKFNTTEIYKWYLTRSDLFAHATIREGAVNESLIVNLSDNQYIYANFDVEEF